LEIGRRGGARGTVLITFVSSVPLPRNRRLITSGEPRANLEENIKPVAFYSDKHGIFRVNSKEAAGGDGVTQFGRALLVLNIDIICANSPQAKGRIELALGTLQDRVVKELRLAGYRRLPRRTHGYPGSSPPTTRASAVIRRMARTCIGRWRKRMIWTRSWPGERHRRAGRLENRDQRWSLPPSAQSEQ
jgi:hypothetical protein